MAIREYGSSNAAADEAAELALFGAPEPILEQAKGKQVVKIPLQKIQRDESQPRTKFDDLEEFAKTLDAEGQLQPILVQPVDVPLSEIAFQIVVGERRYWAARKAGWSDIDAIVVEKLSPLKTLSMQVAENADRDDFTLADICRAIWRFAKEFGETHSQIAKRHFLKASKGDEKWVGERFRLWAKAQKDKDLTSLLEDFRDVLSHAQVIITVNDEKLRKQMIADVRSGASVASLKKTKAQHDEIEAILKGEKQEELETGTTYVVHPVSIETVEELESTPKLPEPTQTEINDVFDFDDTPQFDQQSVNNSLQQAKHIFQGIERQLPIARQSKYFDATAKSALKTQLDNIIAQAEALKVAIDE